ncbi:hypothetical protein SEA_OLICIOUS_38 [Streptomyces phage Olicious]|uniref:Uncharacterized protein n=7 Tax=Immanueltrevirus immanuel3 TaxID=2846399 RepID=A0A2H5BMP2_9CAUD|nr:hypothetical protein HWB41_gp60 [Streptomyces phage Immanuel3]AUG87343.1 hypothetical protein SEA_HAUGEANATOR_38 [Streptomyces phage HaugeAnator]AUG87407.1 hypothetical protein SEA_PERCASTROPHE_38 [Streptomyces phage Percastrophe]AUG87471.1 hypothetical protein SEA_ROMERO_38 [Streptomyces phage Romero]AUG87535.1 hypothetical protein SEA_TORITOKI_38 [Streptomyces phage ToriToki]AUG87599.1 hypothetical protein SEA_ZOOBEAR_38 [Streptomyces phage ZooBear]AZF95826.1 hypothetical protein SEA_OLI
MSGNDNVSYTVRTVSAAGTSLSANDSILVMTGTGAKAVALQSGALAIPGRQYTVVNSGASGNITITPAAGLIDGAATLTVAPSAAATFVNDGTNWQLISVTA